MPFGFGNNNVVAKPTVQPPQTTYLGNALEKTGKFANEHTTATKAVEYTSLALGALTILNTLAKRYAPNKYETYVTQPWNNRVISPLQKKGWIAKSPEKEELYTKEKGVFYNTYRLKTDSATNGKNAK